MVQLQVTFQAKDLAESRYLYDQLSILSPICVRVPVGCKSPPPPALMFISFHCPLFLMAVIQMALTAGSPVFHGKLVDTDTRWDVISSSVDCRTPAERGLSTEVSVSARRLVLVFRWTIGVPSTYVLYPSRRLDAYTPTHQPIACGQPLPWQRDPAAIHSAGEGKRRIYKSRLVQLPAFGQSFVCEQQFMWACVPWRIAFAGTTPSTASSPTHP